MTTINAATVAGGSQQVLIGLDFDAPCVDVAESYCPTLFALGRRRRQLGGGPVRSVRDHR